MSTHERFVTPRELGEHLGISYKTVLNKTHLGHIPCHRLPGSIRPRYRISEVERVMATGRRRRRRASRGE
jgi:predicted site-specific integrase-resolvase